MDRLNIDPLVTLIKQFKCPKDEGHIKFISINAQDPDAKVQRLFCEYCVQDAQGFIHVDKLHEFHDEEKKSNFDTIKCKSQLQELEITFGKALKQLYEMLDEFNESHFLLSNHNKNIDQITFQKLNDLSIKLSNLDSQKKMQKKKLLEKYDQLTLKLQVLINIVNQQKLSVDSINNSKKYNSENVNHILYYEDKLITANLDNQIIIWEKDKQQHHYYIQKIIQETNNIQQIIQYSEGIIVLFPENAFIYNLQQYLLDIKNQQQDPKITPTKIISAISQQTSLVIHKNNILLTGGQMLKAFRKNENQWKLLQKIEESNIKYLAQNDNLDLVVSAGLILNVWKFDNTQKLNLYQELQKSNCYIIRVQFGGDFLISSDANYQIVVYQMQNSYYRLTQKLENYSHGLNLSIGKYLCFGNQVFKFNKQSKQWVIHKILVSFGKELCTIENNQNLIVGCSDSILVFEL